MHVPPSCAEGGTHLDAVGLCGDGQSCRTWRSRSGTRNPKKARSSTSRRSTPSADPLRVGHRDRPRGRHGVIRLPQTLRNKPRSIYSAGLALAAAPVPIEEIGAQYAAETGATNVACSQAELTVCYGLDAQGAAIAGTYADGVFTPLGTAPTAAAPTGAAPTASFGPGMQLVGTDIQPGTYRATSEEGGFALCHWSRLSGVSGDSDDRISYESVHDAGVQVLTEIAPTDFAFESSGCTWTRCDDCVSGTARFANRRGSAMRPTQRSRKRRPGTRDSLQLRSPPVGRTS